MKKIKLLLAAMAAMVSLGVQAGSDWVAPSAPAATDPVSGGVYKIRNVGAGQYLSGGQAWYGWSTSAVLKDVNAAYEWTLTGSAEAGYTLACNISGNNKLFTSGNEEAEQAMHVDGGSATTYFLEKQESGYYRIRQKDIEGKYVGGPDAKGGILAQVDPTTTTYGENCCDWEFVPTSALTTYGPTLLYAEMRAKALSFVDMTEVYTDPGNAVATLTSGIYAQDDIVDAATTASEVNDATAAVKALMLRFLGTVDVNKGKSFDLTFLMTNPDLTNLPSWQKCDGWTSEQSDGNYQVMNNDNATSADGTKTKFYEYWSWNAKSNGKFNLYNAVTLPEGTYTINCYAFARQQDGESNKTPIEGVFFYANDTQGTCVSSPRLTQQSISFINDTEQEVRIGLKPLATGNTYNWMGIGYVELYKVYANTTKYAINVSATKATVATTVDGEEATEALSLKTVTLTITPEEGCFINSVTASYTVDETVTAIEVANPAEGVYTFQMPEGDVNVSVIAGADKSALATAIADAGTVAEASIPAAAWTALNQVLTDAKAVNDDVDATTAEANEAAAALNTAIAAAKACVAPTKMNAVVLGKANTTTTLEGLADEDKATLQAVIDANADDLAACATADAVEAQNAALWTAIGDAINTIELTGAETLDITFLLTNPDLTGMGNGVKDGWYNDQAQPTQNSQAMTTNQAIANTADPSLYAYYEYWSNSTEATEGFTVYQKVTLPEGTYKMTALAYAGFGGGHRYGYQTDGDHSLGSLGEGSPNVTFSAGDIDGSPITTTTLEDAAIDFIQTTAGEVKIGLKAHENNRSNWMGIGYVQLFKVATSEPIVIAEDADYTPESAAADVTLKRTFVADNWNTFVVPFQITNAELTEAFGANVAVAEFSETIDGLESTATFTTMETPAIMANTPVLIKVDTEATEFEFKGRTVAGGTYFTPGVNFKFQGTYAATTTIAENDYFISADKLYRSTGATTIKGTRAYLADQTGGEAEVKLFIDGLATRISEINGAAENGAVYNLAGQRVNKAHKLYRTMKKNYIIPALQPMSMDVERVIAGSITAIGGDAGIEIGEGDAPGTADAPGNPFGDSIFE